MNEYCKKMSNFENSLVKSEHRVHSLRIVAKRGEYAELMRREARNGKPQFNEKRESHA